MHEGRPNHNTASKARRSPTLEPAFLLNKPPTKGRMNQTREKTMENNVLSTILSTPIVYNVTDEALSTIESNWEIVPDCHEKENYEIVRKGISEIVGLRGDVERRRKELKKDALEYGRNVDAAAKSITARLLSVEERLKTAKGEVDEEKRIERERKKEAERQRLAELESKVQSIRDMASIRVNDTSETIRTRAAEVDGMVINEAEYQDLTGQALSAQFDAFGSLIMAADEMSAREKRAAEERAELERQRAAQRAEEERLAKLAAEQEERDRIAAEKRAAEEARLAAERKKIEQERIEQERIAARQREEERIRIAEERAKLDEERRRLQAEQEERDRAAQKVEAERRAREEARLAEERAAKEAEEQRKNEQLQTERFNEIGAAIAEVIEIAENDEHGSYASHLTKAIIAGEIPYVKYVG